MMMIFLNDLHASSKDFDFLTLYFRIFLTSLFYFEIHLPNSIIVLLFDIIPILKMLNKGEKTDSRNVFLKNI